MGKETTGPKVRCSQICKNMQIFAAGLSIAGGTCLEVEVIASEKDRDHDKGEMVWAKICFMAFCT